MLVLIFLPSFVKHAIIIWGKSPVRSTLCYQFFLSQNFSPNLATFSPHRTSEEGTQTTTKSIPSTMKVRGTSNTLKCCVSHNPYNNETYLYVGRDYGILVLQWYVV